MDSPADKINPGSPADPRPFGKYLLMGMIARGGMAEVYRARKATDARLYAIKCMRPALAKEAKVSQDGVIVLQRGPSRESVTIGAAIHSVRAVPADQLGTVAEWASPAHSTPGQCNYRAPFDTFSLKLDPRDPAATDNRRRWAEALQSSPVWLRQVHGADVVVLPVPADGALPVADASVTAQPGIACTVMVADCSRRQTRRPRSGCARIRAIKRRSLWRRSCGPRG